MGRKARRPAERAPAGGTSTTGPTAITAPDAFWFDEGTAWVLSRRTSLSIDPCRTAESPTTPAARDGERPYGTGPWDSHLDLNLDTGERVLQ